MASEEVKNTWPQIPETDEERMARIEKVARAAREIFGGTDRHSTNHRCPQCSKKMVAECAYAPNEFDSDIWVLTCWGCGYESRL